MTEVIQPCVVKNLGTQWSKYKVGKNGGQHGDRARARGVVRSGYREWPGGLKQAKCGRSGILPSPLGFERH